MPGVFPFGCWWRKKAYPGGNQGVSVVNGKPSAMPGSAPHPSLREMKSHVSRENNFLFGRTDILPVVIPAYTGIQAGPGSESGVTNDTQDAVQRTEIARAARNDNLYPARLNTRVHWLLLANRSVWKRLTNMV